ncbi:MAG: hypothetical protein IPH18_17770 [Chitinophagaceae bacterium]|nr:hypothetical protein [Chitinophagaceae bacterium]
MKVAIFESSEHITKRLIDLIGETNQEVIFECATNNDEAVFILQGPTPDVILMDVRFPGSRFEELLGQIKQQKQCNTSLIILYHVIGSRTKELYKTHGADYFIDLYLEFENIPGIINELNTIKK